MLKRNINHDHYRIYVNRPDSELVAEELKDQYDFITGLSCTHETYSQYWQHYKLIPPEIVYQVIIGNEIVPHIWDDSDEENLIPQYEYSEVLQVALEQGLVVCKQQVTEYYEPTEILALPDYTGGASND